MPAPRVADAGHHVLGFGAWRRRYAERGIATFPGRLVGKDKKPLVSGYLATTLAASAALARKFATAPAFGFALGAPSKITVLDVDAHDERVLADAMDRHGQSSIVVRSGSGNYQAWYRHSGEPRRIRPWQDKPIDLLGGGFVVAPPSKGTRGSYEFMEGSLDDLDRLPALGGLQAGLSSPATTRIAAGGRNQALFKHCMRHAHACDDLDTLFDVARTSDLPFVRRYQQNDAVALVLLAYPPSVSKLTAAVFDLIAFERLDDDDDELSGGLILQRLQFRRDARDHSCR